MTIFYLIIPINLRYFHDLIHEGWGRALIVKWFVKVGLWLGQNDLPHISPKHFHELLHEPWSWPLVVKLSVNLEVVSCQLETTLGLWLGLSLFALLLVKHHQPTSIGSNSLYSNTFLDIDSENSFKQCYDQLEHHQNT